MWFICGIALISQKSIINRSKQTFLRWMKINLNSLEECQKSTSMFMQHSDQIQFSTINIFPFIPSLSFLWLDWTNEWVCACGIAAQPTEKSIIKFQNKMKLIIELSLFSVCELIKFLNWTNEILILPSCYYPACFNSPRYFDYMAALVENRWGKNSRKCLKIENWNWK